MPIREATIEQVEQLPLLHEVTIPAEYLDEYGHMNVRWYSALWGAGASVFMQSMDLGFEQLMARDRGHWVLRQVLDFLAEIREGDDVAIYGRLLGFSEKRLHNKYWMINKTKGAVASTSEVLVAHADLKARRMAPFPDDAMTMLSGKLEEFRALGWDAPVSGAIQA